LDGLSRMQKASGGGEQQPTFDKASVAERLVGLAKKKGTTASELWPQIAQRTDLLYSASEDLLSTFKAAMHALVGKLGADDGDIELVLAPTLKDPVRVHEKAMDDYQKDFSDWKDDTVIPESCVLDMMRGRAVCKSGEAMVRLQQMLMEVRTPTRVNPQIDALPMLLQAFLASPRCSPSHLRRAPLRICML
jgi:hypothetical protein